MRKSFWKNFGFGLLLIFLFLLNFFDLSNSLKGFFHAFSAPLETFFWQAGRTVSAFFALFPASRQCLEKEAACQQEKQKFISQLIYLEELKKENQALKEALKIDLVQEFKLVLTRLLARQQDTILINQGSSAGLSEGLALITPEKALVGQISKLSSYSAQAKFISHPDFKVPGKILQKNISGLIQGAGFGKVHFEYLPQQEDLEIDDIVVTESFSDKIPQNVFVGKIQSIEKSDVKSFWQAEILPAVSWSAIPEELFVIVDF